ncbi:MAG: hypothetical protein KCHDKBKB_02433 [Elusimicrobia bacterium]|nr:hypothetical protein [Elusimicrobiota bacterium]
MATLNLRRFSNPEALKVVSPNHLSQLLLPFQSYFSRRGVDVAALESSTEFDFARLVGVLMAPDEETPKELSDQLYLIHEMASEDGAETLVHEAKEHGIDLEGADITPADVAIQMFLKNRELLERKHAEQFIHRPRSFEYFQVEKNPVPEFTPPDADQIKALESDLSEWFLSRKRGGNCRVFFFSQDDGVWFMVRHGDLYKREGTMDKEKSGSVCFRPEVFDVLRYDAATKEIGIHAASKKDKEVYRKQFGFRIFGDENFFPGEEKYTLEPLRAAGAASLVCDGFAEIEWIRLKEVHFLWGGPKGEREIRRADDLFASWERTERKIHPSARIVRASFSVKFADAKTPRTLTLLPSNVAHYVRDHDGLTLERFLLERGFIIRRPDEQETPDEKQGDLVRV